MMSGFVKFCPLILFVLQGTLAMGQSDSANDNFEGNVQLVHYGNNGHQGVLQVFYKGNWNTVCYKLNGTIDKVTNRAAAAAACRQLKHTNYRILDSAKRLGYITSDKLPETAIAGIRCPEVKFLSTEGDIFLMRCDNSDQLIPTNECEELVGIQCYLDEFADQQYNGKIRRFDNTNSDRPYLLQINFENEWLPVCTKSMSNASADSACRQLGFTNSILPPSSISNVKQRSWKIDVSTCSGSFPCLSDCISQSVGYQLVERCDEYHYQVYCYFDKSMDGVFSAGNEYICTYQDDETSSSPPQANVAAAILGMILGMVILGEGIIFYIYIRRKKRLQYKKLDGANEDNVNNNL